MIESVTSLSHKSYWETPKEVFKYIEKNYLQGKFTMDLCATPQNTKCKKFITPEDDLFKYSKFWNEVCFMNPPYTKKSKNTIHPIEDFIFIARQIRNTFESTVAVLVFSNITSTSYFQKYIGETENDRRENRVELYFYPKRIRFLDSGKLVGVPAFASMVIIFRGKNSMTCYSQSPQNTNRKDSD